MCAQSEVLPGELSLEIIDPKSGMRLLLEADNQYVWKQW
eukprot:COSAG02_NODE_11168_length_1778_cov_1.220369_1_plen_38_part_10